jgi:uncharacterized protein (TIGR03437 family)
MISRRRLTLLLALPLLALAASGDAASTSASYRPDAPFVALASGHVAEAYDDRVSDSFDSPVVSYRIVSGTLPAGLVLDPGTGTVTGTPTAAGSALLRIAGTEASGQTIFLRASIAVFSADESEVHRGQSFEAAGPCPVTSLTDTFAWTSSFDQTAQTSDAVYFVPQTPGQHPVLVFHYGRGFTYQDYGLFLTRVASWGIVCAAASDLGSFGGNNTLYDSGRPELGMESASAAQEALLDHVLQRAATPGDALAGAIDPDAIFVTGHSRGGGATHASHVRSIPLRARGVIYFMGFDLRYFQTVIAPALSPAYAIPTAEPRLPSLVISAEHDGDLAFPYADEFIDRATGPTTFVTVDGACHNFLSDTHASEKTAFGGPIPAGDIDRTTEQSIIASWVVAFVRRWASLDLSLEALLYGDESASSSRATVASWRRSSPTVLVDDFQDADPSTNLLQGQNGAIGLQRTEESSYPALGDLASMGLQHSVMKFTSAAASYSTALGPAGSSLALPAGGAFLMRVAAPAGLGIFTLAGPAPGAGYQLGFWVRLRDAAGNEASVKVANEDGTTQGYLPGRPAPGGPIPSCDRFVTLEVLLGSFVLANPKLDLAHVAGLDLVFALDASSPTMLVVDDLRFEGAATLPALRTVLAPAGEANVTALAIASAYGPGLATVTATAPDGTAPPLSLGGTALTVTDAAGTARAAAISYVSPTQVNFVVPAGTAPGTATVAVTNASGSVVTGTVAVVPVSPGIFSQDATGSGVAAASFVTVHADGSQTTGPAARYDAATSTFAPLPVSLAGDPVYLVLFGTGLRAHAGPVTVAIGGVPATVTYAGPQLQFPGLDQVNVLVPSSLAGSGTVGVAVVVDGLAANVVSIAFQ